jgi:hypothetical protein
MNSPLNITKGLSTEVEVVLVDSNEVCGNFFLADHVLNHYGGETLLDLLNQDGKEFIPLEQGEDFPVILINKSKIIALKPKFANSSHWPNTACDDGQCWQQAKIISSKISLEGRAYTGDMQPERRRLGDLLNHSNQFFVFETDEGPWIINKNLMTYIEPLPGEMQK